MKIHVTKFIYTCLRKGFFFSSHKPTYGKEINALQNHFINHNTACNKNNSSITSFWVDNKSISYPFYTEFKTKPYIGNESKDYMDIFLTLALLIQKELKDYDKEYFIVGNLETFYFLSPKSIDINMIYSLILPILLKDSSFPVFNRKDLKFDFKSDTSNFLLYFNNFGTSEIGLLQLWIEKLKLNLTPHINGVFAVKLFVPNLFVILDLSNKKQFWSEIPFIEPYNLTFNLTDILLFIRPSFFQYWIKQNNDSF